MDFKVIITTMIDATHETTVLTPQFFKGATKEDEIAFFNFMRKMIAKLEFIRQNGGAVPVPKELLTDYDYNK